jgi:hypothetical protein
MSLNSPQGPPQPEGRAGSRTRPLRPIAGLFRLLAARHLHFTLLYNSATFSAVRHRRKVFVSDRPRFSGRARPSERRPSARAHLASACYETVKQCKSGPTALTLAGVPVYLAAMDRALLHRLTNQAMACRKLAWSMGDQRASLLLHEMASECELRARRMANYLPTPEGASSPMAQPDRRAG